MLASLAKTALEVRYILLTISIEMGHPQDKSPNSRFLLSRCDIIKQPISSISLWYLSLPKDVCMYVLSACVLWLVLDQD